MILKLWRGNLRGGEMFCVGQYHEWDKKRPRVFGKGPWFKMRRTGGRILRQSKKRQHHVMWGEGILTLQILEDKLFCN